MPFTPRNNLVYNSCAGWSSLAARRAHNPKVTGSNPVPATNTGKPLILAKDQRLFPLLASGKLRQTGQQ